MASCGVFIPELMDYQIDEHMGTNPPNYPWEEGGRGGGGGGVTGHSTTDFSLEGGGVLFFAHRPSFSSTPRVPPNPVLSSDLGHLFFVVALTR